MSNQQQPNADLTQFEAALAKLVPRTAELDRDELLFAAARAAAEAEMRPRKRPLRWLWPSATAAMTLVAITTTIMWQNQRVEYLRTVQLQPTPDVGPTNPQSPGVATALAPSQPVAPPFAPPAVEYLALRERVLRGEWRDPLPASSEDAAPASPRAWPQGLRWPEKLPRDG